MAPLSRIRSKSVLERLLNPSGSRPREIEHYSGDLLVISGRGKNWLRQDAAWCSLGLQGLVGKHGQHEVPGPCKGILPSQVRPACAHRRPADAPRRTSLTDTAVPRDGGNPRNHRTRHVAATGGRRGTSRSPPDRRFVRIHAAETPAIRESRTSNPPLQCTYDTILPVNGTSHLFCKRLSCLVYHFMPLARCSSRTYAMIIVTSSRVSPSTGSMFPNGQ